MKFVSAGVSIRLSSLRSCENRLQTTFPALTYRYIGSDWLLEPGSYCLTATPFMLLTGASRGIGHATVKLFQENGWKILTVSRQPFSEECRWPMARESHIQADLADLSSIDALAEMVRQRLPDGKLAALVNNAGISPKSSGGARMGVAGTDADTWTKVLNVNLISTALLARALVPELQAARGSIVNVTSIAGSRVHPFAGVAYAASKAGLSALTRELAHEFGPRGIRERDCARRDRHIDPIARNR